MKKNHLSGQSMVALIIFISIATIMLIGSTSIIASNTVGATIMQQGLVTRQIAESGIENALILLLRNPSYMGETLPLGEGSAVITVTGDSTNKTIESLGTIGNFQKKITVKITYNRGVMSVVSWEDSL